MSTKKRIGFSRPLIIGCITLLCSLWSTGWGAKIVYPWRATTAIVKAGATFDVWFVADSGQTVNSVQLQGPYNTVNATISQASGSWIYDKISGNTYNKKITVTVPAITPEDRYNLVVKTSTGDVVSKSAVKVIKQYLSSYYIVHISDAHRYQSGYNATNILKRVSKVLDYAGIMDAQMVIETGDLMYGVDNYNPLRCDQMYDGIAALGVNGLYDCFAPTFMVDGNHDNPTDASVYGNPAGSAQYFNTYHGLTYYNFAYGNGRFMIIANSIGANTTTQVNDAKTWLNSVGNGTFRLGAFHGPTGTPVDLLKTQNGMTLGLAGHTHTTANNPEANNVYVASDLRANFQFNLYKINNDTGAITLVPGTKGVADAILNMTEKDNPSAWQLKLMLNYAKANNGTSTSNTATITNKFNFAIDGARIRFVMPKGNTYAVSAGTIQQQFDGTTYRIVDVKVNVAANGTAVVGINKTGSTQVSVPNVMNMTEVAAKTSITGAGLTVSGVSSNYHATVAAGIIYSQTPGGGTLVAPGSSVALAVSKGPSNQPPYFVTDPFSLANATSGSAYSQSISAKAVDPEGGTKTYSKVAGPVWLSLSSAGSATGTPGTVDVGTNSFSVKVTDNGGLSDTATMKIVVVGGITIPVVSFIAPTNLTVLVGSTLYVNVGATDPNGISVVRLYKNGVQLVRSEGAAPYEWNGVGQTDAELQNLQAGSFVLTAKATDSAGTVGEKSITVNVVGGIPSVGSIVTLKAVNGKYVSATYSTNNTLIASKTTLSNYERFKVVNATNCVALQCMGNNKFVSIDVLNGSKPMVANRASIGSYEKFQLIQSGSQIAIKSVISTNYASAISGGAAPLQANQTYIGSYEKFTWKVE